MKTQKSAAKQAVRPLTVTTIKRAIKALPDAKVEPLLNWLRNHYDGDVWDRQMAADVERLGDVGFGVALGGKPTGDPDNPLDFGELHDMDEVMAWLAEKIKRAKKAEKISKRLVEWAEVDKFKKVQCQSVGAHDVFQLQFWISKNTECRSVDDIKKHLGYIARGAGFKIPDDECVVSMDADRVWAWFKLEPRPKPAPEQTPKWRGPSAVGKPYSTTPLP